jgi:3-phosphoglycerate kinase
MLRSIKKLPPKAIQGKTVLLRVDFNVEDVYGKIHDDYRIRASLPTIQWLLSSRARVVLMSHRGRPSRKNNRDSLRPVARHLSRILKQRAMFFETLENAALWSRALPKNTVGMLENLRFWSGEEKNDAKFARMLAQLGDIYVNDAFGVSHRKNASIDAITRYLPSYAGLLLEREVKMLSSLITCQKQPFTVILGGAKLFDKVPLIRRFQPKARAILTGGGIANTFLAAKGLEIGDSLLDRRLINAARGMLRRKNNIFLPVDYRMGHRNGKKVILDIGPKTEKLYALEISRSRTILWNGPMGFFEDPKFAKGSYAVARAIAKNQRALSVVGGGETTAAFRAANSKFEIRNPKLFLSTGGGAMLEYLAGKKLPGIEALLIHIKNQNAKIKMKD